MTKKQPKTKIEQLDPFSDRDRELVNFNLKCLEIAAQLLGPIKHDPKKPLGKINLDRYAYASGLVEEMVTRTPVLRGCQPDGKTSEPE